jgi:hypothetical protein
LRCFGVVLIKRARKLYLQDDIGLDLTNTVYALDSTTIDLCLSLFPWADFRATKAAVKMHTPLDLRGPIPSFIHISNGKMGDARALDLIAPEAGTIDVMDRGYVDFRRLYVIHQAGAFFVARAKINMKYHRVDSRPVDKTTGVSADQTIALDGFHAKRNYPQFYGTSANAVKTQIWIAVCVYVLAAIIKKELALDVSLYTLIYRFCPFTLSRKPNWNASFLTATTICCIQHQVVS